MKIGVENLATEEGRLRFFENLKAQQLIVDNAILDDLLPKIESTVDDLPVASTQKFVNLIKLNDSSECTRIRSTISTAITRKEPFYINSLLCSGPITSKILNKDANRTSCYNLRVNNANTQALSLLTTLLLKEEYKPNDSTKSIIFSESYDNTDEEIGMVRREIIHKRVKSFIISPRPHPINSKAYRHLCNLNKGEEELFLPTSLTLEEILLNPVHHVLPILPPLRRQTIRAMAVCF